MLLEAKEDDHRRGLVAVASDIHKQMIHRASEIITKYIKQLDYNSQVAPITKKICIRSLAQSSCML